MFYSLILREFKRLPIKFAAIAAVFLASCQTIPVKVPEIAVKQSVEIHNAADLAAIGFDRIGIKVRRGAIIGTYEADILGFTKCFGNGSNIFWNQGRVSGRDIEFADIFFNEMKNANFNITGNPDKLFASATADTIKPQFLVGGQIVDIKLNACHEKNFWTGLPRLTVAGKGAVRVRWQLFNVFEKKVVFETITSGSAKLEQGVPGGEMVLIQNAFGNAVVNLEHNHI